MTTAPQSTRYNQSQPARLAPGWKIERLTQPSRLHGANGMRTGADGMIYVAQVAGSQVSAVDPESGLVTTVSPLGGAIVGPDDLCFDDQGNLFVTEITENRVSMRLPNGATRVLQGDMPVANPITFHRGMLIAGECRSGGRIMELDRNGGSSRSILANVPMPNAFEVGPDGKLYFPVMGTNEIWRVGVDGGEPEVIAGDLGVPNSVKFDSKGFIVSTQVASGEVLQIDPRSGTKTVLASIGAGLDNCVFVGDQLFASHITGSIHEILSGGKTRALVDKGMQWPMDIALGADGTLFIADGGFAYTLRPGGAPDLIGMLFSPGFPGFVRGSAAGADPGEWIVSTALGTVARWRPAAGEHVVIASGLIEPMGVAILPGGAIVVADAGSGDVLSVENGKSTKLAGGLNRPIGVAVGDDGTCYAAESGAQRIVKLIAGGAETILEGFGRPEGIAFANGRLYVLDAINKDITEYDPIQRTRQTIAASLPVGAPPGVLRKFLGGVGDMCGPMTNFAGITVSIDGSIYISADAEGSVSVLRQG